MNITQNQATEIYSQLGQKALVMMGARDKTYSTKEGNICFKIGRNAGKITHIKISLTGADLYDVEFLKIRAGKVKTVSEFTGVYNDQLHGLIEEETGMYLSL